MPMPSPHKQAPEERRVQREGEEKKKRSQQVDLDYINGYTLLRLMNIGEQLQSHELSMTNPCKAFSSGSLCSWEASGRMSRGRAAGTSPERLGRCSPSSVTSPSCGALHGDGGYQSSSYLSINGTFLPPVHLDIDTDFQAVREQEKEDIKLLNNQFVTLIEKVQCLEQQNKILTTRWNFLKDQDNSHSESDMKAIYDQYMSKMNQEMQALNYEQENLESELTEVLSTMDSFRSKDSFAKNTQET